MEPIGATASIITLIQATAVLAKSIQNIYSRWKHAPDDLQRLAAFIVTLHAELDIIHCTSITGHPLIVDVQSQKILGDLLRDARQCVEQFSSVLLRVQAYGSIRQRTMWAKSESQNMESIIIKLRAVEERLSHWLQVLSLYVMRLCIDILTYLRSLDSIY